MANAKNRKVHANRISGLRSWTVPDLIAHKRDGKELTAAQIRHLVGGYVAGEIPDYQMAALAMAILFRGMSPRETAVLTLAMRDSGRVADLSKARGPKIDKHSTGGVGDKVSLCLAPLVASCGVRVPMISGRGLGHTGGTLDKLEAIPGFSVQMPISRFERQVQKLGCAMIGQTRDLAPADKRLYALRDVTATVESVPLITASILSKKLAEGIDGLVMDVKVGRGAFMKTVPEARTLASALVAVGRQAKKRVTAVLTRMDSPLGMAIGNALETAEAFQVLRGQGPADLLECTLTLGGEMLRLAGLSSSRRHALGVLNEAIHSGRAAEKMERMIEAQGGDPRVVSQPGLLPQACRRVHVKSSESGYIGDVDALSMGKLAVRLGAGRTRLGQAIDPAAGIVLLAKPGDSVTRGAPLACIHLSASADPKGLGTVVRQAFRIQSHPPRKKRLIVETIRDEDQHADTERPQANSR